MRPYSKERGRGLALVVALLCLLLPACSRETREPIKIGLAINLSGRGGDAGEHIRNGALLAVDEINAAGGIHGRPLQLLVRDDENSDEGIRRADSELLDEQVIAIIGHSFSANTMKAYPLVTGRNTLLITAYTGTTKLSGKDDLFFRTSIDSTLYGSKTAALLKARGAGRVAVLMDMDNADFVEDYVEQVRRNFEQELHIVRFGSRNTPDWHALVTEMLAPAPAAVLLLTEASMTAVAAQKLRELGFQGPVIATIWAQSPELLRVGGPATEGVSLVSFVDPDNQRPAYARFAQDLQARFQRAATARSDRAYEIVQILADALKRSKAIETRSLKEALLQGRYESILGPVRFDAYGDVVRPVYEVVVRDGTFVNAGEIR
ncbi:MAG: hypothetical protein BWK76_21795 [Desulfobulbaceae bacterium A2]|nr:MAG: hypothetical protein BWK76_21795 [Desulfobulbaceae bacterium A2]